MGNAEIDKSITKQGKKILLCIYDNERICSSELALCLNISRSAMSNALERLKSSSLGLISSRKQGRQKEYSLTEFGTQYVEDFLNTTEMRVKILGHAESLSPKSDKRGLELLKLKIRECYMDLEEEDGDWEERIIFLDQNDDFSKTKKSLNELFQKLLKLLLEAKLSDEKDLYIESLMQIRSHCGRKCIDDIISRRKRLNYLWDLAANDWKIAYQVIDVLFQKGSFITAGKSIKKLYDSGVGQYELQELTFAMQEIVTKAKEHGCSKDEFCEKLLEEGAEDNQYVYYIAEKYMSVKEDN